MRKHRAAVVGCGALAQARHLPNLARNPRVELAAVCDVDESVAEACRQRYGAERAETGWRKIVDADDIGLVVLATHTNLRGALIVPALAAGKPVYTEKPLSPDRHEMIEIVRAARRTGVPVCVGHNRRSSPAMLEFTRLLERAKASPGMALPPSMDRDPERAPIPEESRLQVLMRINDDARSWKEWVFWDEEGIMFAEMVHFIDLALAFNGAPPVRVFAEGSCRGNFTLLLRFADGSLTTLQHTMTGHFDYPKELFEATCNNFTIAMDQHVEVRQVGFADEACIRTFPFAEDCFWPEQEGMQAAVRAVEAEFRRAVAEGRPPRGLTVNKGHFEHMDRFLDHIEGAGPNPCGVESAVAVSRVALKCLESARLGLPAAIGPEDWHLPPG